MIIKFNYINEGVFGSYKNKRSADDKKKVAKQNVENIYKNVEKGFAEKIYKELVDPIFNKQDGYQKGYFIHPEHLHLVSKLDENCIPLDIEYKKDGRELNVLVRLLVFLHPERRMSFGSINLDEVYSMTSLDLGCLHSKDTNSYYSVILQTLGARSRKLNSTIGKDLKEWFDADVINWDYKYHLVDPNKPFKLFNKNIFYGNVSIPNKYTFDTFVFFSFNEFISTCFEWFNILSYTFTIENINNMMDMRTGKCIVGNYGKYIKTSHLYINVTKNNDIDSLGNYKELFLEESPSKETITVQQLLPNYLTDHGIEEAKKLNSNDTIITDEMLMEIIGLTNEDIINMFHLDKSYVLRKIKVALDAKKTKKIESYDFARKPAFMTSKNQNLLNRNDN